VLVYEPNDLSERDAAQEFCGYAGGRDASSCPRIQRIPRSDATIVSAEHLFLGRGKHLQLGEDHLLPAEQEHGRHTPSLEACPAIDLDLNAIKVLFGVLLLRLEDILEVSFEARYAHCKPTSV
jgi:hypothetical protein